MGALIGSKGGDSSHVHYEAPDSLHSISYARVLDLVSEGEILGLAEGLASVFLDGTRQCRTLMGRRTSRALP